MIRTLRLSDLKTVIAIHDEQLKANWTEVLYMQELLDVHTIGFVYEHNGVVVGFVLGKMLVDSSDLYQVAVVDAFKGQGLGYKLLSAYWDEVIQRGGKESMLEVNVRHDSVVQFYKRFGYKKVYIRKNYYGRYRDALIMKKEVELC